MIALRYSTHLEERYRTVPGNEEEDEVMPGLGQKERAKMLARQSSEGTNSRRRRQYKRKHEWKCLNGERDRCVGTTSAWHC